MILQNITSVVVPFLMPMLLGRSIDLTTYTIGGSVYDDDIYDETDVNQVLSAYILLQGSTIPYAFMGLPVDIVLRIKSGFLSSSSGSMGLDGLLKETAWKQRSAVLAVATAVQTVQRSLKKNARPLPNWSSRISASQTHYANSIVYGGWSFILYRFECNIPGDVEIVRETLASILGDHGDLGPETIKLWEKATDAVKKNPEIRGKVTLHFDTYSTFPFKHNITSPNALLKAVSQIPELVGPVGKPMMMELLPLHDLDRKYPVVEENHKLDRELEKLAERYDDVKNTKNSINRWVSKTDTTFTDEQEGKIADLLNHLSACLKLFHQVASEASVYKAMNRNLLNSAILLYSSKLKNYAYTYDRLYRRLKEDVDAECEDSFYHKVKGLLKVDERKRIEVGKVKGGLMECKAKCLAEPKCRSLGYVDQMLVSKVSDSKPRRFILVMEKKICYLYFRTSSTADVIIPKKSTVAGVYDRKCQ